VANCCLRSLLWLSVQLRVLELCWLAVRDLLQAAAQPLLRQLLLLLALMQQLCSPR
jgi:hypothetical protein